VTSKYGFSTGGGHWSHRRNPPSLVRWTLDPGRGETVSTWKQYLAAVGTRSGSGMLRRLVASLGDRMRVHGTRDAKVRDGVRSGTPLCSQVLLHNRSLS
jgi:hypothetical protein